MKDENRAMAAPLCGEHVGLVPFIRCTHNVLGAVVVHPAGGKVPSKLSVCTTCAWVSSCRPEAKRIPAVVKNRIPEFLFIDWLVEGGFFQSRFLVNGSV